MKLLPGKLNMIIDGQFGSTGKGLISAYLASENHVDLFVSNLSPNAGHTFNMCDGKGDIVVKQLPVGGVLNPRSTIYLSAGSIIDPKKLLVEIEKLGVDRNQISIHPRAAIIFDEDISSEKDPNSSIAKLASTQSGVGVALSNKILRKSKLAKDIPELQDMVREINLNEYLSYGLTIFMESSQGLDLGINSGLAYPFCTSRDITPSSLLSDAQVHPKYIGNVMMSIRTYPIRVGNLVENGKIVGTSGPFYEDSVETTWDKLGVKKELTTVTKRVRRVATFSKLQLEKSLNVIKPKGIFLNFANYLKSEEYIEFIISCFRENKCFPTHIGYGANIKNIYKVKNFSDFKNILYAGL